MATSHWNFGQTAFVFLFAHLIHSFTDLNMKVSASLLTVLATLSGSVVGHASGGKPALMAKHARAAREAVSASHVNTRVRRTCKPRPAVSYTGFLLPS